MKKHYLPLTLLVDGRNFLYKCYNGSLKESELVRSNTNGVKYFLFNIQKILHYNQNEINHFKKGIFFFDGTASGILKTAINPEYKKSRHYGSDSIPEENYDDDFKNQERALKKELKDNGFYVVSDNEVEADDLIGYYVKQNPQEAVHIVSNDSDFYQLLSDNVSLVFTGKVRSEHKLFKKNYVFTNISFIKKYSMHPLNMRIKKVLVGDKADDLNGVDGLSESFFNEHFLEMNVIDMEDVYEIAESALYNENIDDFDKSIFENILNSKELCDKNFKIIDLTNPIMTDEARDKVKNIPNTLLKEEIRVFLNKKML